MEIGNHKKELNSIYDIVKDQNNNKKNETKVNIQNETPNNENRIILVQHKKKINVVKFYL